MGTDDERATIVHQLMTADSKNSHNFLDDKDWKLTKGLHPDYYTNHAEYFHVGRIRQHGLMKRMGTAVYNALPDKSKFAGLVDRKKNPHWEDAATGYWQVPGRHRGTVE